MSDDFPEDVDTDTANILISVPRDEPLSIESFGVPINRAERLGHLLIALCVDLLNVLDDEEDEDDA